MAKKPQKKKLPAKKVSVTKSVAKQLPKSNTMALATVSYNDIVQPETHKGELGLLASYFPDRVVKFITQPTPAKYVFERDGAGGNKFKYIAGWYAKKCANYAFGFNHSFEIKKKELIGLSAIVEGRLIISDPKTGRQILYKDDIGGHTVKFAKGAVKTPENAVDIANDFKAAATDAFKRCMHQLGFFADVYGVNEAKQDGNYNDDPPADKPPQNAAKVIDVTPVAANPCGICRKDVPANVLKYSQTVFKATLCRDHQTKTYAAQAKEKGK